MDLRDLRYVVAIAEERSLTRAAARLHMTQPPLSAHLRDLERRLGARLFVRHRRGVDLTETGQHLVPRAARILDELEALERSVRSVGQGTTGRLTVAFDPALARPLLTPLLTRVREELPDVTLEPVEAAPDEAMAAVRAHHADAALLYAPPALHSAPPLPPSAPPALSSASPAPLSAPPVLSSASPAPLSAPPVLPSVSPALPSVSPGLPSVSPGLPAALPGLSSVSPALSSVSLAREVDGLETAVIAREPMVAVVPASRPVPAGRLDLADLRDEPFLVPARAGAAGLHTHLLAACRLAGFSPAAIRDCRSVDTAIALVAAGLGVSALPAGLSGNAGPGVAFVPLSRPVHVVETVVAWDPAEAAPALRRFLRIALATPEPDVLGPDKARRPHPPAG